MRTTFIILLTLGIAFGAQAQTICPIENSNAPAADESLGISIEDAAAAYTTTNPDVTPEPVNNIYPLSGKPTSVTDNNIYWSVVYDDFGHPLNVQWYTLSPYYDDGLVSVSGDPINTDAGDPTNTDVYLVTCGSSSVTCPDGQWDNGGTCTPWSTECPVGEGLVANGTNTSDITCILCTEGWNDGNYLNCVAYSTCGDNADASGGTAIADVTCTCESGYYDADGDNADSSSTCTEVSSCGAGEYVVTDPTSTTNRVCGVCTSGYTDSENANSCTPWTTCEDGETETQSPSATQDRVCTPCATGKWDHDKNSSTACVAHSTCGANASPSGGTAIADVTCTCESGYYDADGDNADSSSLCTAITTCGAGEYVVTDATSTTNRICGDCPSGTYNSNTLNADSCTPWTTCPAGQYETVTPSATQDRVCENCAAESWDDDGNSSTACVAHSTCGDNGVASGGTKTSDVTCTCINSDYYDADGDITDSSSNCTEVSTCDPGEYIYSAPNSTTDRDCQPCTEGYTIFYNSGSCTSWTTCPDGQQYTEGTATSDTICTICSPGEWASSTCGDSCAAGYGFVDGSCVECEEFTFNANNGTTDACAVMSCDPGHGVSNPDGPNEANTCVPCTGVNDTVTETYSDDFSGQCKIMTVCNNNQYISTQGTASSNRECTDYTSPIEGKYISALGDEFSDVIISQVTCEPDQYIATYSMGNYTTVGSFTCETLNVCAEGEEYEFLPAVDATSNTDGSNRECSTINTCGDGEYILTLATATADTVCGTITSCSSSQYISVLSQDAIDADTPGTDQECTDYSTPGENQFVSVLGDAGNDTHVGFNVTISNAAGECDIEQYVSELVQGDHNTVGSVTCTDWTDCVAGQYAAIKPNGITNRECAVCPSESYSDTPNADECTAWVDCLMGEYVFVEGTTTTNRECAFCGVGNYTNTTNAESCTSWTDCVAGEYVTFGGSTVSDRTCALCDTNTYSADVNQLLCATVSCAEDSEFNWVDPTSNDGNCVACDTGYYSAGGLNTCNSCDAGYGFADGNCTECTDFTFNADDGTTSACAAMSCPVGEGVSDPAGPNEANTCVDCAGAGGEIESYSDDLTGQCKAMTVCQPGYRMTKNGTHVHDRLCAICPVGTYSDTENADECTVCDAGFFAAVAGSTSCTGCPAGTYLEDAGTDADLHDAADDCSICGAGTYAAAIGSDSCTDCPVGTFLADEGTLASDHDAADDCGVCGAGTYAAAIGSSSCTNCIAGMYLEDAGTNATLHDAADDCSICGAGRYSGEGAETCSLCDAGTYLADEGTDATLHNSEDLCLPCAKGHHASNAGSASCDACQYPFYAATEGQAECDETNCPAGKGIRTTVDYDTTEDDDYNCNECSLGHASAGGTNACDLCNEAEEFGNVTGLDVCHVRTVCQPGQKRTVIGDVFSDDECEDCVGDTYTLTTNEATCTALSCAAGKELTDVRDRTQDESGNCEDCGGDRWSSAGDNVCVERTKCAYDEEFGSIPQVHTDYTVNRACTTVTPCRAEDQLQADDKTDTSDYVCSDVVVEGDNFIFSSYADLEKFESVDPDNYYESTIFGRVLDALPAGKSLYVDTADSYLFGFLFVEEANEATPLTERMNEIGTTRVRVQGAGVAASSVLNMTTLNALTCADKTIDLSTNGETVKTVLYDNTHYALACDGDTLVTAVTIDDDSLEYWAYCHDGTEFQYVDSATGPGEHYTCAVSGDYKHFIASYVASGSVRTEVSLYGDHLVVTGASASTGGSGDTRALYFNIHVSRTGRHELDEHDGFAEVIVAGNIVVDSNVRAHVTEGANGELLINNMAVYQYIGETDGTTTDGLNVDGTGEWERMDKYGDGFASCIEVGQRVLMADGTHKNVEHIVPGDVLRTPEGRTTVRSTRRGGRHLSGVHDVECNGMRASLTGQHAYHCEGEWRLPSETHRARALEGVTEVIAIETDNYCEDKLVLESGLAVESWDGRGVHEWRSHSYENGRRLRCTLKGSWRDSILKRTDERVAVE